MTIKKTKVQRGAMEYQRVKATFTKPMERDKAALVEIIKAASPRGRVAFWKPHVERLKVDPKDLAKAESLIDARGEVSDMPAFDLYLTRVQADVELMQLGKTLIPPAAKGQKFSEGPKRDRVDTLAKEMQKAWKAFIEDQGQTPTARELWDWIPETGKILEKTVDYVIHWKRANGQETKTTFKAFQNRYTTLKMKLSQSVISK